MSEPADVDVTPASDDPGAVTVVGTAHISQESADRVRDEIEREQPDLVAVELDEGRYRQLQGDAPDDLEASDLLEGNTVFQFLAYWMLSYVQKRMGERFDVDPGADMKAAVEAAEANDLGVALVDRDIQTTTQRFWARLTFVEKLKMMGGLALGVTHPRTVAAGFGIAMGAMVGLIGGLAAAPALGLGELATLGISSTGQQALVGGVVGGAIAGLFAGTLIVPPIGGAPAWLRGTLGGVAGIAAGVWIALADPTIPLVPGVETLANLGQATLRGATGLAAGTLVGGSLGLLIGIVLDVIVDDPEEIDDDFDIEDITDGDVVTAMLEEFRRFSPGGAEALIDERDAFIGHKLVALRDAGYDVVAVVGAGHRAGIESYLDRPETLPPMESITGVESGRRFSIAKAFGYLVMIGFLSFFILLAMAGVQDIFLLKIFGAWFLFNGIFAFAAARLAGARLTSAGVGGAIAWLTSINPLLAPGWFAGYVELRHRTVNVGDIETLNALLDDHERPLGEILGDMLDVPLFRLIAVVAMTNVGSLVATLLFPFVVLPLFFNQSDIDSSDDIGRLMLEGAQRSVDRILDLLGPVLDVLGFVGVIL
jgi:pheromone shutdown protein TraB